MFLYSVHCNFTVNLLLNFMYMTFSVLSTLELNSEYTLSLHTCHKVRHCSMQCAKHIQIQRCFDVGDEAATLIVDTD